MNVSTVTLLKELERTALELAVASGGKFRAPIGKIDELRTAHSSIDGLDTAAIRTAGSSATLRGSGGGGRGGSFATGGSRSPKPSGWKGGLLGILIEIGGAIAGGLLSLGNKDHDDNLVDEADQACELGNQIESCCETVDTIVDDCDNALNEILIAAIPYLKAIATLYFSVSLGPLGGFIAAIASEFIASTLEQALGTCSERDDAITQCFERCIEKCDDHCDNDASRREPGAYGSAEPEGGGGAAGAGLGAGALNGGGAPVPSSGPAGVPKIPNGGAETTRQFVEPAPKPAAVDPVITPEPKPTGAPVAAESIGKAFFGQSSQGLCGFLQQAISQACEASGSEVSAASEVLEKKQPALKEITEAEEASRRGEKCDSAVVERALCCATAEVGGQVFAGVFGLIGVGLIAVGIEAICHTLGEGFAEAIGDLAAPEPQPEPGPKPAPVDLAKVPEPEPPPKKIAMTQGHAPAPAAAPEQAPTQTQSSSESFTSSVEVTSSTGHVRKVGKW